MKWIGLTGGLGTGKSTVANLLRQQGYVVLDADRIAEMVVAAGSTGLKSVIQKLGPDFLLPSGQMDRARMAKEVFSDPKALADLESIVHPLVKAETQKQKDEAFARGHEMAFYDVPLLFEKNIPGFDAVIVVATSEELQKKRIGERNSWSETEINDRLKSQWPLCEKIKKADYVIHNNGSLKDLELAVEKVIQNLESGI